jgi:hypothetical protein
MTVPRVYLEHHIATMKTHIVGKFSELIFNLDEVGSSEWDDRKPRKAIASQVVSPEDVYHSVARIYGHVTLLACVSATGDALTPMVMSGATIRDSIWRTGLRRDEDLLLRHRSPAYIDENLFHEYISEVLIPYVANLREKPEFANEIAILLMDSAPAHRSERVLRLLGENRILAVVFPAHTTNILQALDLVFFGAMKKLKATASGEFGDNSSDDQILKLVHAYEQTATSMTIRSSFKKAGLYPDIGTRPFTVRFDEDKLRSNPGFRELWERNISIEELSRRRQLHPFGMINSEFLVP